MTALAVNKRSRKPKGQIRMEYPETLATISTQDTGREIAGAKIAGECSVGCQISSAHSFKPSSFEAYICKNCT
jgi:hypothetical protein